MPGVGPTPDLKEFVYTTILRLRHMNLPMVEIGRQLGWHEANVWQQMKPAKKWFAKHLSEKLDPYELLMSEMIELDMLGERALTKAMAGQITLADFQKAATIAMGTSKSRAEWLDRYGYFDAINFHRLTGGDVDSAEARADIVRAALTEAFDDDVQPVATGGLDGGPGERVGRDVDNIELADAVGVDAGGDGTGSGTDATDEMDEWPDGE